jgi:aminoglycoside 6'-N-acetyltransferase
MFEIRQHNIVLEGKTSQGRSIKLRPIREEDWNILVKWNSDPEVLYYSEGDDVSNYTPSQIQKIYRSVSKNAFCFIIEVDCKPVGECWIQKMNLERILQKYPNADCRRIDLTIAEKEYWGQGIGTEVIRLLTEFGFLREKADMIFGCDIADYNTRSLRAFEKVGYEITLKIKEDRKAKYRYDVALTKEAFLRKKIRNAIKNASLKWENSVNLHLEKNL